MSLRNCPECGKVYLENPANLCLECYAKEQQDADKVADFLRDHPRSHINDIHEATGVKHKVILRMLKKGRITGDISYPCESCGKTIMEGRLCSDCSGNILGQMRSAEAKTTDTPVRSEEPKKKNTGMFTTRF